MIIEKNPALGSKAKYPKFKHLISNEALIEYALDNLAANIKRQPSLAEIASWVNLSEYQFQRIFSGQIGISLEKFLKYLKPNETKERVAASSSLLDLAYDKSISKPEGLQDPFVTVVSMTPSEYNKGVVDLVIRYGFHACPPLGECLIMETDHGICGLAFVKCNRRQVAYDDLAARWPRATFVREKSADSNYIEQIFAQTDGGIDLRKRPLRLFLCGTQFQIKVWKALLTIPMGALTTYADLAERLGYPRGAARAVGSANGANAISYLIPCHRVVRKSGEIGGYHWGQGRKLALLGWEATRVERFMA